MNGTHPFPAPSLRELSRPTGVTEGVSPDGSSMPTIYSPAHIYSEIFDPLRSPNYTPSASLRSAAPSEREPGWLSPSIRLLAKTPRCGRFSSPLRNSDDFGLYHSTKYTPSVSPSGCQLPQRGSRERLAPSIRVLAKIPGYGRFSSPLRKGWCHSPDYSLKSNVSGDFHRPYESSDFFTIPIPKLKKSHPNRKETPWYR